MSTLEEMFPPFGLRISCRTLRLAVLRDEDLPELVELVRGGIQVPDLLMPFLRDWHQQPYQPGDPYAFPATSLSWWWSQRSTFAPEEWRFALTVRHKGELVGMQDVHGRHFPQARHVLTGSWLGRSHQGQGIGTLMRQMVVGFAFDELGVLECESGYVEGNAASAAVSRKVGYVDNGHRRIVQNVQDGAQGVTERRVLVTPETFRRPGDPVTVEGARRSEGSYVCRSEAVKIQADGLSSVLSQGSGSHSDLQVVRWSLCGGVAVVDRRQARDAAVGPSRAGDPGRCSVRDQTMGHTAGHLPG